MQTLLDEPDADTDRGTGGHRMREFYLEDWQVVQQVVGNEWRVVNMSYLQLGREVSRMAHLVGDIILDQVKNANRSGGHTRKYL